MAEAAESQRNTLLSRFHEGGVGEFDQRELIELLLILSTRKKDTDGIAGDLFDFFGSMSEILEADPYAMMYTEGVSKNSAVLLSIIPQLSRRVMMDRELSKNLKGLDDIRRFVPKCFIGRTVENFLLICLDEKQKMIRYDFVSKGTVNSSTVDLRRILHLLLVCHASYAVVAHNHPRGRDYPSKEDLKTTQILANALKVIDVELLDHLIVSTLGSFSIAQAEQKIRSYLKPD